MFRLCIKSPAKAMKQPAGVKAGPAHGSDYDQSSGVYHLPSIFALFLGSVVGVPSSFSPHLVG